MQKEAVFNKVAQYITENQARFYRFAVSHTKDREASLDIVQNAICRALEKYADIRKIESINSWFYRILLNEIYAYMKKKSREVATSDEDFPIQVYTEKAYDKDDSFDALINRLPEGQKTIIILRFFEEMSLEEISKITGTNLNTVKTRLYGALKKLKVFYKEAE